MIMKNQIRNLLIALAIVAGGHRVAAQGTVFTYQGRVTDNGTNFNGAGQFKFALVTSTNTSSQATATADAPSGGFVTIYNVTFGGSGYVTAPGVTVSGGGGSNATAHATVSGGAVTAVTGDSAGSGYSNAPTVTIDPPPANIVYTTYWSNDGTSVAGSEPSAAVAVNVSAGLFTVVLGDTTLSNMAEIPASLLSQPNLQLRIWFDDGANGFAALSPVQNLTPTPYAVFANTASNLVNGLMVQPNANGAPNVIGGSSANFVSYGVVGATIGGGGTTNFFGFPATNSVSSIFGTVAGGCNNTAGGYRNSTVSGGVNNTASTSDATVGGGEYNTASGDAATVGGGFDNIASGDSATVSGGQYNTAGGEYSFAAGYGALATNDGAFVWSDSYDQTNSFSSTADYQFSVLAHGGVRLVANVSAGDISLSENGAYHHLDMSGGNSIGYLYGSYHSILGDGIHLGYNYYYDAAGAGHVINTGGGTSRITAEYGEIVLAVGGVNISPNTVRVDATTSGVSVYGTFNNSSDRNAKQDFAPISTSQMLQKVAQLPLSEWSYKDDPTTRHVGPMGQDFYSTFNLGTDEKHIAPIDEGGVALAAIQGLNQKLEAETREKDAEIEALKAKADQVDALQKENDVLTARLNELEATVKALAEKK